MNRVFGPQGFYTVPDGTLVSPFLNPMDSNSGLPRGLGATFSLAAGTIQAGTFLQLINPGDRPASVLYIVGPPYVFERDDAGHVVYDDAVVLDEDWDQLSRLDWDPPRLRDESTSLAARHQAIERIVPNV